MKTFWLSFAGDDGFLGAVIADADSMVAAVKECHRRKINPGGEVLGFEIPDGADLRGMPKWKLLQKSDIDDPVRVPDEIQNRARDSGCVAGMCKN